jgi:tetratricopeptide (TPR) repeat protein
LKGDVEAIRTTAALARGKRSAEDLMSHLESLALARAARLQDARRTSSIAVDVARSAGQRERGALFDLATAVWDAFYGNAAAARQRTAAVLEVARGRDVDFAAAFALATAGDVSRARTLAGSLEKNFPEDTSAQYLYLPALRALFALHAGDPAAAIQALQIASRYDLARGGIGFIAHYGVLYPIYVRGQAYLAANQPAQAAAEFQRILDRRHIVLVDPVDAIARLQLARAFALSGDTAKAKSAYDELLTLWKNADTGIPIVEQARAEAARLR